MSNNALRDAYNGEDQKIITYYLDQKSFESTDIKMVLKHIHDAIVTWIME